MTENFIQLKKDETILRLGIKTADGKDTGEFLEFDLEDIELPLRYQEMIEKDKKNKEYLKNQLTIIEKRQDVKGKKLMSKNQEDEIRAINEFFKKEIEICNMFLGENGVQKLLNGRKLRWTTLNEINEIIKEQIAPHFDMTMNKTIDKIKEKYGKSEKNTLVAKTEKQLDEIKESLKSDYE